MNSLVDPARQAVLLRRSLLLVAAGVSAVLLLRRDVVQPAAPMDRMVGEWQRAEMRADTCSSSNAVGVGLRGEYFAKPNLQGQPVMTRVDSVIDLDVSAGALNALAEQPVASVRWSGWVKPPLTGAYRFHADAPDMQIFIARNLVAGGTAAPGATVELAAGRFYPIEVIVNDLAGANTRIRLEWTAPRGARYVVPRALLHLPSVSVASPSRP